MGRAPCCDKANVKKGPWSQEEDYKLKSYIQQHGTGDNWITLPQKIGLKRCGKSCRLRWLNYLRPNIKHGGFSEEEDNIIFSLYVSIGSRWSVIAAQLPGRTDNDIKNYWNTKLKKKFLGKHNKEHDESNGRSESSSSNLVCENSTTQQHILQPYFPVLQNNIPVALPQLNYTNQSSSFNDQDSIRRSLMKLGGRFCDEDDYYQPILDGLLNFQLPNGVTSTQQIHEQQVLHINNNNQVNQSQINDQCFAEGVTGHEMVQFGQGCFTATIEDTISAGNNNFPQEFFYAEDMRGSKSSNWGETSSNLIYPS